MLQKRRKKRRRVCSRSNGRCGGPGGANAPRQGPLPPEAGGRGETVLGGCLLACVRAWGWGAHATVGKFHERDTSEARAVQGEARGGAGVSGRQRLVNAAAPLRRAAALARSVDCGVYARVSDQLHRRMYYAGVLGFIPAGANAASWARTTTCSRTSEWAPSSVWKGWVRGSRGKCCPRGGGCCPVIMAGSSDHHPTRGGHPPPRRTRGGGGA